MFDGNSGNEIPFQMHKPATGR